MLVDKITVKDSMAETKLLDLITVHGASFTYKAK